MISIGFCPHGREEKQGARSVDDRLKAAGRRTAVELVIPSLQTKALFPLKASGFQLTNFQSCRKRIPAIEPGDFTILALTSAQDKGFR